jgi:hypothetical protein
MPQQENPYEATRRLRVPAGAAWKILTCRAGARLWLDDSSHSGIQVGAAFPVRNSVPARVCGIQRHESFDLSFPSGRRAVIKFHERGDDCEISVLDYGGDGRDAAALQDSWSALLTAAYFVTDQVKENRRGRQAIVVIYGVGSQRPMSTVKSFTHALISDAKRWNKPDQMSASYELRRYQLPRGKYRPRTDLFELYWADEVPGTQVGQVLSWLRSIMFRQPRTVDAALRPIAYLAWATVAAAALAVVALALTIGINGIGHLWQAATGLAQIAWVSTCLSLAGAALSGFLTARLGNAARYLDPAPGNIAVRQSIRQHGVDLLRKLHEEGGYDRIAIVGHSLGSVIGYDIIRLYWSQVHRQHASPAVIQQTKLAEYLNFLAAYKEQLAAGNANVDDYRSKQRALWREYRCFGLPWLVTDLITIGNPLTHAGTLLARSPADLDALVSDLELPACPPHGQADDLTLRETFLTEGNIRSIQMLTQAAPFALTRWTNIYAPTWGVIFGDPIGGPLTPVFGIGIKDMPVAISPWWRGRTPLAHTSYWLGVPSRENGGKPSPAIAALRKAVDLESGRWLDDHLAELPWEMSIRQVRM